MITKEIIKKELDKMPDDVMQKIYDFINNIKTTKTKKGKLHTYRLKGKFDITNVCSRLRATSPSWLGPTTQQRKSTANER